MKVAASPRSKAQVSVILAFVISHTTFLAAQDDEMRRTTPAKPSEPAEPAPSFANDQGAARPLGLTLNLFSQSKRRCEITIISFSRSICREGLAALIGMTEKPYPNCLSCHSHPIRPFRAPSPRGVMLLS